MSDEGPLHVGTDIPSLLIQQVQTLNDIVIRMADFEVRLMKLEASQMRLLAFAGIVGTGAGFALANLKELKQYIAGLFT